jgi:quinol monooxygenase YgiN
MVSFTVRMTFATEDRADIAEALRKLAEASRQEPGCVTYVPHQVEGETDTVVIYEQYADSKAQATHRETAHFKQYAVGVLYQKMRERHVENLIALI